MTQVAGAFPYDVDHLLGGAARILVSDDTAALPAVPTKLEDVIDNTFPYAPNTGYVDLGATKEGASYSRDISAEGFEIQQSSGAVLEEVTEVERQLTISVAELRKEHFKILEESQSVTALAESGTLNNAQDIVKFGSITDLTRRRMVVIGMRSRQSGEVKESATRKRGRFLALALYSVALAADESEVPLEKGELAELPIAFKAFPQPGQNSGEEVGFWLDEHAGDLST